MYECLVITCAYGLISIGRDALFSEDDVLQAGDGHSIFDVITEKN